MDPNFCLKSGPASDPNYGAATSMCSGEHQGANDVGEKCKSSDSTHAHTHARTPARTHARSARRHARARAREKRKQVMEGRESTQGDEVSATLGYCPTPGTTGTRNKYARVPSTWRAQHRSQGRRHWAELISRVQDNAFCFEQLPAHAIRMPRDWHARKWRLDSPALTAP